MPSARYDARMADDPTTQARLARSLLRSSEYGVLATMSTELPGYPFGSVTPFVTMHGGQVAIQVSGIAQHTRNMLADRKVCLTVAEHGDGEQQALGRVSVVGDAEAVPQPHLDDVQRRYFRLFPAAQGYASAHDFSFFWITPKRVRFIGGFGRIFWVEPAQWSQPAPQWRDDEAGIIAHMNDDHGDALRAIVARRSGVTPAAVEMLACDVDGFHVRADGDVAWVAFDGSCATADEVREAMVRLAVDARRNDG